MPTPRAFVSASALDGKIYVFGGSTAAQSSLESPSDVLATVEVYDPATDTWAAKPDMPTPRKPFASYVIDDKLYVFGGDLDCQCSVEVYDPVSETWEQKADMPFPREQGASAMENGKVYLFGGMTETGAVNVLDVYDPLTDTWTQVAEMLTPRYKNAGCSFNGMIYTIGGAEEEGKFSIYGGKGPSSVGIYNIETDEWKVGTEFPPKREEEVDLLSASSVDSTIYVIGGKVWGAFTMPFSSDGLWAYTPEN